MAICQFCRMEIEIVPDVWHYLRRREWHDVRATDNDSDGRYHTDCEESDTGEHVPIGEEA